MKNFVPVLILLLAAACGSTPTRQLENSDTLRIRVEIAIARQLLNEVGTELPRLKGSMRSRYLEQKTQQFRRSVDLSALNSATLLEFHLLEFLDAAARVRWQGGNYETQVRALSSIDVTFDDLNSQLLHTLNQIDQTLLEVNNPASMTISRHMEKVRQSARYPEDSFTGRQNYLDDLQQAMQASYEHSSLMSGNEVQALELRGQESGNAPFHYTDSSLVIDLNDVRSLPYFELEGIATFYGYPGRTAIEHLGTGSLRSLLQLPGYSFGWAWLMLEKHNAEKPLPAQLYFAKLMAGLALADLRLHSGTWSRDAAASYLFEQTPYGRDRLNKSLDYIQRRPGFYLAAFAGRLRFTELQRRCINSCDLPFLERLVTLGPLPFDLLEERLLAEQIIQ